MQYRPGPWKICGTRLSAFGDPVYQISEAHREGPVWILADVRGTTDRFPRLNAEGEANAALIVAAPDLLAVAERIQEELKSSDGVTVGAEEDLAIALRKATGRI